ncbi:enoyl-CoA hydratase [Amycolatopsis pithecellobii]|uniref:Enoyl-CoA hydratase n=1 Tax=Amycolatopsis pithecellobii TaxID=664692 RepID=A0A6N7YNX6_9PSEU|nr:enoyl-CoA hydratase [Amycolatopsis pithecellobii]MTD54707.1 enoyl-CoA hydratase [Amycolatopsis pithecellobii]
MTAEVHLTVDDGIAVVTIANPTVRNAMDLELSGKLTATMDAIGADEKIGAVVITGEPPAFCAGGDLVELQGADPARLRSVYSGFLAVARSPLPTVAAVNGAAVGAGLNLALACDLRLAGPRARFDTRFLQLGLHPGGGYTWMADRALGAQGAKALTLFGDVLDADEAERVGLVWRRYDDDATVLAAAREFAGRAAAAPRSLVQTTKATMSLTAGAISHAEATEIEVRAQAASTGSPEFLARVTALQAHISSR